MKIKILIILFLTVDILQAQKRINFQSVKLDVLIVQLLYSDKDIKTVFDGEKMYYLNSSDNTKLFSKGFDIAYPFFKKSAIVKFNGKYGIIDKKGNFLIEPKYKDFELAPYEHECNLIIFEDGVIFDLDSGIDNVSYTICEEPAFPELYSFMGKNKQFGVKEDDKVILKPIYDTIYGVEMEFIIASKKEKIGLINLKGKQLTGFKYDEVSHSEDIDFNYTYPIFGLRENETWTYFEKGKKILKSNFKCTNFLTQLENSIGIFNLNSKENILFKNGTILKKYYDFISGNGLIGVIDDKIFRLKSDGSDELYFQGK